MMSRPSHDDLELYVMGAGDDPAAIEAHLATDAEARAYVADQARLELMLREVATAVTFCRACDAVVRDRRCDSCGAAVSAGGFQIDDVKVQNAHGRLYLAHDADGRKVALKELAFVQAPGAEAVARFEREAMFLRALNHPAIPRFVASFQEGEGIHTRLYLAQEYIEGESLDRRLAEHWYDEREIVAIGRQVLEILIYLQRLSPMVVHRDIKPANLVRRDDGSIALVDFGAAFDLGGALGSTVVGTFGYMPLEQMAGIVDASTDPYALGASLLHLLTRREPWKLLEAPALGVANVSPGLRRFLERLVARDPAARFASAADALQALDRIVLGKPAVEQSRTSERFWIRRPLVSMAFVGTVTYCALVGYMLVENAVEQVAEEDDDDVDGVSSWAEIRQQQLVELAEKQRQAQVTALASLPPEPAVMLPAGKSIDLDVKDAELHTVVRDIAGRVGVNLVIPDAIRARVTVRLTSVPWDEAMESVLEAHGLWYAFRADGTLLRVAPRRELDAELMARNERFQWRYLRALDRRALPATLPPGAERIDIDLVDADLHNVLRLLADAGKVSLVLPQDIQGKLTVRLRQVPWTSALETILQANGLWYQYRPNGKVLRVAPQKQLDAEEMAAVEREGLQR